MSNLEKMIKELCPNGVDFEPLGKAAVRTKGTPITAGQMKQLNKPNAPIKIFAGGKTIAFFDYADLPAKDINTYPSVIVKSRGVIEFEYYDKPFSHKNEMWSYHSERKDVYIKYLYYFLKTQEDKLREKATSMGAFPQISIPDTENLLVPIPHIDIQREIVKMLDNFAELTAELTTELTARKKQYEYYRNELLTFGDDVAVKTLGEVAKNLDSKRRPVTKGVREAGEYPYYGASGIVDYVSNYIFDGVYLLVSEDGANLVARVTPIAFTASGKIWVNNHAHVLQFETYVERRFIEYYLNMIDLSRFISTAAQPKLNQDNLNKIPVPVPEYKKQARIVEILDKFDTLTTDITKGLPAEIAARQKQYEYYRDKLLMFKEKGA
jgi:type I restriction enzyme S subunit